jgi:hypothetical protein
MEAGRGVENVPPPRQMPPTIASQPASRQQEVMQGNNRPPRLLPAGLFGFINR